MCPRRTNAKVTALVARNYSLIGQHMPCPIYLQERGVKRRRPLRFGGVGGACGRTERLLALPRAPIRGACARTDRLRALPRAPIRGDPDRCLRPFSRRRRVLEPPESIIRPLFRHPWLHCSLGVIHVNKTRFKASLVTPKRLSSPVRHGLNRRSRIVASGCAACALCAPAEPGAFERFFDGVALHEVALVDTRVAGEVLGDGLGRDIGEDDAGARELLEIGFERAQVA